MPRKISRSQTLDQLYRIYAWHIRLLAARDSPERDRLRLSAKTLRALGVKDVDAFLRKCMNAARGKPTASIEGVVPALAHEFAHTLVEIRDANGSWEVSKHSQRHPRITEGISLERPLLDVIWTIVQRFKELGEAFIPFRNIFCDSHVKEVVEEDGFDVKTMRRALRRWLREQRAQLLKRDDATTKTAKRRESHGNAKIAAVLLEILKENRPLGIRLSATEVIPIMIKEDIALPAIKNNPVATLDRRRQAISAARRMLVDDGWPVSRTPYILEGDHPSESTAPA